MLLWVIIGGALLLVGALILLQSVLARPQAVTGLTGDGSSWGPADAPVKVINFSNFGCSHCRTFALSQGEEMRNEYEKTGKVRFEFKHFRLGDPSTNDAANASECAADQGKFWDYHNTLFAKQSVERVYEGQPETVRPRSGSRRQHVQRLRRQQPPYGQGCTRLGRGSE